MIRKHENKFALRAGMFSVMVHGLLLALMLFSFHWKTSQPISVAEVQLWDALPADKPVQPPKPQPEPEPVKPEPQPEPKPEPKPAPPPEPEPKADIQVKKEPVTPPKPKQEKPKPEPKKEQPKPEAKPEPKKAETKPNDALKKLQQALLEEDAKADQAASPKAAQQAAQQSAASQGEIDKYKLMIINKIKRYVNNQLCGTGKPELTFELALMPTGEVMGTPRINKSSGIGACDDAVTRAILQAQPLPLPQQPDLQAQFRNLELKFRPNE